MPSYVHVSGLGWRNVLQKYVYVAGAGSWKLAQRAYTNVGGTWKVTYARTPNSPYNVTHSIDGHTTDYVTSTSPVVSTIGWSLQADDIGLPGYITWVVNSAVQFPATDTTATSATKSIVVNLGDSLPVYAVAAVRNGETGSFQSTDVYSSSVGSSVITVSRPQPTITNVGIGQNSSTEEITVGWLANNAPAGALYRLYWRADVNDDPFAFGSRSYTYTGFSTNASGRSLTFADHGYDIQDFLASDYATFYITVQMYDSSGSSQLASSSENSYYTPVGV